MKTKITTYLLLTTLACSQLTNNAMAEAPKNEKQSSKRESIAKLPPEKRELLQKAVDAQKKSNNERYAKLKAARNEMRTILLAPNFDKKAYLAKAEETTKLESINRYSKAEAIAGIAGDFSADERKILADYALGRRATKNKTK